MNPASTIDNGTATRIRGEWNKVTAAFKDKGNAADQTVEDPLGQDGLIWVRMAYFKAAGGGEVLLRKGTLTEDRRYTRFRVYGDTIEKSSFLKKKNGATEFHKRKVEAGDKVTHTTEPDGDDKAWMAGME